MVDDDKAVDPGEAEIGRSMRGGSSMTPSRLHPVAEPSHPSAAERERRRLRDAQMPEWMLNEGLQRLRAGLGAPGGPHARCGFTVPPRQNGGAFAARAENGVSTAITALRSSAVEPAGAMLSSKETRKNVRPWQGFVQLDMDHPGPGSGRWTK